MLILLLLVGSLSFGQAPKPLSPGGVDWCGNSWGRADDATYLKNLADSPLTLSITENKRHLLLSNTTAKQIVGYKLASLARKNGVVTIARVSGTIVVKLNVNEGIINPKEVEDELVYCRKKKAILTVIEATFTDGTVWKGRI